MGPSKPVRQNYGLFVLCLNEVCWDYYWSVIKEKKRKNRVNKRVCRHYLCVTLSPNVKGSFVLVVCFPKISRQNEHISNIKGLKRIQS